MPSALQFWKSVVTNPLQQFQTPTLNKGSCRSYLAQCLEGLRMKSMKRLQITLMANSRLLCKTLHAFLGSRKGEDKKWWNRVFFYFIDLFLDHFHQWCVGFLYRENFWNNHYPRYRNAFMKPIPQNNSKNVGPNPPLTFSWSLTYHFKAGQ